MKTCRAPALALFDTYADMADEQQSEALAALRCTDAALHDALVELLVADALAHTLDVPPWLRHGTAVPGSTDPAQDNPDAPPA